jgi:transcriptional regulator with XRE-family HTH domain
MNNLTFMTNLRRIRKAKGLSQQDLAEKCNLAKTVISYYENHAVNPPLDKIEIIANALNINIGDLLNVNNINKKTDYEDIDPRILKKIIKIQSLPKREQKKITDYIDTIIKNFELNKKQKELQEK